MLLLPIPIGTSLNEVGLEAASWYRIGLMGPKPGADLKPLAIRDWSTSARIAANVGAPADVPPTTLKFWLLSRKPLVQVDTFVPFGPSSEQNKYPSWNGEAFTATSGTSRLKSLGTPVTVCQVGLRK